MSRRRLGRDVDDVCRGFHGIGFDIPYGDGPAVLQHDDERGFSRAVWGPALDKAGNARASRESWADRVDHDGQTGTGMGMLGTTWGGHAMGEGGQNIPPSRLLFFPILSFPSILNSGPKQHGSHWLTLF
jgi:hypothetical protein